MRAAFLCLGLLVGLSGCGREPSFEERYERETARIDALSAQLENEFANQAAATRDAENAMREKGGNAGATDALNSR